MISITEKSNCCGCGACAQKCPRQCIVMKEDAEGFLYPKVNQEECVECGLCDSVCPMKSPQGKRQPLLVIAAKNTDLKVREASSSGGVFHLLAQGFVERGGVVFGAEFDEDWSVRHNRADNVSGIHKFMGSKYSQSRIDTAYIDAEKELKAGREVLFSGAPCQKSAGQSQYSE